MRKNILLFMCTAVFALTAVTLTAHKNENVFAISGAEIAMELTTETVLTENNADAKLPMASTTKILTAIIVIEDCNIDEVITVPKEAVGVEGSSIYLNYDEQIDIRDLLYGLMLRSGNDSAAALAIHHSGSIEKFSEVMNERAKKIGAANSNFKNPSGLPNDEHYTTARDLCKIACHAMRNETFRQIVSSENYNGKFKNYVNKNKMLKMCEGANGVKTGYTVKAGRCLVSSAERNGMDIVTVVLNCPEMYERSCSIFNSCFERFKLLNIDTDRVFMCNNVLCKLKKSQSLVVDCDTELTYRVNTVDNSKTAEDENYIADLEIYSKNDLIFKGKLYSILSD